MEQELNILCIKPSPWKNPLILSKAYKLALGSTQPPIASVPWAVSSVVRHPGRETDTSPPSNAEVKITWSHASIPHVCLRRHAWLNTGTNLSRQMCRSWKWSYWGLYIPLYCYTDGHCSTSNAKILFVVVLLRCSRFCSKHLVHHKVMSYVLYSFLYSVR
jgi:hypothetical protein